MATPGIEVINLVFAIDEIGLGVMDVYIFQVCVIRMRLSVLTSPREREYICIGISIDSKNRRFIVTQILLNLCSRVTYLSCLKPGDKLGDITAD